MFSHIKDNLKGNLASYILVGVGVVLSAAAGIIYAAAGVTAYTDQTLDTLTLTLPFIAAGVGILSIPFGYKTVKYLAFLASLFGFLAFIRYEVTYISNVFQGIDNTTFSAPFLLNFYFLAGSLLVFLLGGIFQKERLGKKAKPIQEGQK